MMVAMKKEKISKHITFNEATRSETAKALGIDNTPNKKELENIKRVAEEIFEPLRKWAGHPIRINSCFRNEATNRAIGGSKSSAHRHGFAFDLDSLGKKSNAELFKWMEKNLKFDQLIWEFGTEDNPAWIHVGICEDEKKYRNQKLTATKSRSKTRYSFR